MEKKINNIASYFIIFASFIIPLIVSFTPLISFSFAKVIPFFVITFLIAILFIIHIFNEGKVAVQWHWLFASIILIPLVYLISSFTSVNPMASLIGMGTEVGTASTIIGLFLFMYLVSVFMRSKDKAFLSYFGFGAAFLLLALFHISRFFFGADFLSLGLFTDVISNTIGRFSDLGIVAGIAALLSLTSIEFLRLGKLVRVVSWVMLGFSLALLAVTNFPILIYGSNPEGSVWLFTIIGIFALIFFVYFVSASYSTKTREERRRIPIASLVVLVIAIVFTLGAGPLQNAISSFFKVESSVDTRLLWKPTTDLSGSTISELSVRPFFGYGPGQFSYKWMLEKPQEINNTILWNSSFNYGTGFISSTIVTVGLVGFLGWVAFLGILLFLGARALFMKNKDPFSHYILTSSFLVSVYLWITMVIYMPSYTIFILTFFFTGIFIASLIREKIIEEKEMIFDQSKSKSFIYIMSIILILIAILVWGYKIGERVVASVYVSKAGSALNSAQNKEDVEKAKVYLRSAATITNEAVYLRTLATISMAQANGVLNDTTIPVETARQQFQAYYQDAVGYSQQAVAIEPNSFDSYVTYGNILATAVPLGLDGYYTEAKTSYEKAAGLNPKNPLIPYLMAQLEAYNKNIDESKKKVIEALNLKSNYVDAIVLLGQIQATEGDEQNALQTFRVAESIDPASQTIKQLIDQLQNRVLSDTSVVPSTTTTATSTESN